MQQTRPNVLRLRPSKVKIYAKPLTYRFNSIWKFPLVGITSDIRCSLIADNTLKGTAAGYDAIISNWKALFGNCRNKQATALRLFRPIQTQFFINHTAVGWVSCGGMHGLVKLTEGVVWRLVDGLSQTVRRRGHKRSFRIRLRSLSISQTQTPLIYQRNNHQ